MKALHKEILSLWQSTSLIHSLKYQDVKQIWFADDSSASGKLENLNQWWLRLQEAGPRLGYYPNPCKTWIIVKEEHHEKANKIFFNSGIRISTGGREHLGSSIGKQSFIDDVVRSKVQNWTEELKQLSKFADSQPHSAYTHGFVPTCNCNYRESSFVRPRKIPCSLTHEAGRFGN